MIPDAEHSHNNKFVFLLFQSKKNGKFPLFNLLCNQDELSWVSRRNKISHSPDFYSRQPVNVFRNCPRDLASE